MADPDDNESILTTSATWFQLERALQNYGISKDNIRENYSAIQDKVLEIFRSEHQTSVDPTSHGTIISRLDNQVQQMQMQNERPTPDIDDMSQYFAQGGHDEVDNFYSTSPSLPHSDHFTQGLDPSFSWLECSFLSSKQDQMNRHNTFVKKR